MLLIYCLRASILMMEKTDLCQSLIKNLLTPFEYDFQKLRASV